MSRNPHWSSRYLFLLAAVGSAVGLGNIWKFPYVVGENGGGAFVLLYLFCIALVGIPVLIAEILIGQSAQANPVSAFAKLSRQFQASRLWVVFGYVGIVAGFLILSFYSVVAGWSLDYLSVFLQHQLSGYEAKQVARLHHDGAQLVVAAPIALQLIEDLPGLLCSQHGQDHLED